MADSPLIDHAPPIGTPRHPRTWLAILVGLLFVPWFWGMIRFVTKRGAFEQRITEIRGHSFDERNLVSLVYGPSLLASSFANDLRQQLHPLFTIDGVSKPSAIEKWCSSVDDASPWIEFRWFEPARLHRVTVAHGSTIDSMSKPNSNYVLRCLRAPTRAHEAESKTKNVTNNSLNTASHEFTCNNAVGLRVEFEAPNPNSNVCLVEVEAWGQ